MRLKNLDLDTYLFGDADDLTAKEVRSIKKRVEHEIEEIFYGRNLPK
jgi:S-adenosylmethionine decarboxylase